MPVCLPPTAEWKVFSVVSSLFVAWLVDIYFVKNLIPLPGWPFAALAAAVTFVTVNIMECLGRYFLCRTPKR